jgi:hypothetical protein
LPPCGTGAKKQNLKALECKNIAGHTRWEDQVDADTANLGVQAFMEAMASFKSTDEPGKIRFFLLSCAAKPPLIEPATYEVMSRDCGLVIIAAQKQQDNTAKYAFVRTLDPLYVQIAFLMRVQGHKPEDITAKLISAVDWTKIVEYRQVLENIHDIRTFCWILDVFTIGPILQDLFLRGYEGREIDLLPEHGERIARSYNSYQQAETENL